ncbi:unnamed protein product [Blepharisma stoltei]|uniref:Importin subunit alpha n=1 Tax=Blepharisma stoltei TaxID=1481888 RepID=A0AAU9IJ49_9CILI|nr:unnamed protein product [Blepharisma stoltei]
MLKTPERISDRNKDFKKEIDLATHTKNRDTFSVELRKSKRLENVWKRRANFLPESQISPLLVSLYPDLANLNFDSKLRLQILFQIIAAQNSYEVILAGFKEIRKCLSIEDTSELSSMVNSNYIQYLIQYIDPKIFPEIQSEAMWCLANISSGAHELCEELMNLGIINACKSVINLERQDIAENAVWCLANLAGDCKEIREKLIENEIVQFLVNLMESDFEISISLAETTAWALNNIFKGDNLKIKMTNDALPIVKKMLKYGNDNTKLHCLYIALYISAQNEFHVQTLINSNILKRILPFFQSNIQKEQLIVTKIIGNIIFGDDTHTQTLINLGILDYFQNLMLSTSPEIRKEVLWALSNITAGTKLQIALAVEHPVILLAMQALYDASAPVKLEASIVFNNIIHAGAKPTILGLVHKNILPHLRDGLCNVKNQIILKNLVEFCDGLLNVGKSFLTDEGINPIVKPFDESGCLTALEKSQVIAGQQTYSIIERILGNYFGFEEGEYDENEDMQKIPEDGFII